MFVFAFLITKVVHLSCAWNQTTVALILRWQRSYVWQAGSRGQTVTPENL